MNTEAQSKLTEASAMLAEAKRLNDSGKHGAALKEAFHASEYVAVAYLSAATSRSLPPNAPNYDLFAGTIREPNRHPALLQEIREVVGDVCVLREAYHPALLDEASPQDTQQMIDHVEGLMELVRECAQIC